MIYFYLLNNEKFYLMLLLSAKIPKIQIENMMKNLLDNAITLKMITDLSAQYKQQMKYHQYLDLVLVKSYKFCINKGTPQM